MYSVEFGPSMGLFGADDDDDDDEDGEGNGDGDDVDEVVDVVDVEGYGMEGKGSGEFVGIPEKTKGNPVGAVRSGG